MNDEEIKKIKELKGFKKFNGRTKFFDTLIKRLRDANLEFHFTKDEDDDVYLVIAFPNAREKRFITLFDR